MLMQENRDELLMQTNCQLSQFTMHTHAAIMHARIYMFAYQLAEGNSLILKKTNFPLSGQRSPQIYPAQRSVCTPQTGGFYTP